MRPFLVEISSYEEMKCFSVKNIVIRGIENLLIIRYLGNVQIEKYLLFVVKSIAICGIGV